MKCALPYCDRKPRSPKQPLCEGHYYQKRRGTPFRPLRTTRFHEPVGECVVEGCQTEALSHTNPMCAMHDTRVRRHGDPVVKLPNGLPLYLNPFWQGDDIGYSAAHSRIRSVRGKASGKSCVDCGAQAKQWSYSHACERELYSDMGPYSPDWNQYEPRCVPCHKDFDLQHIKRRARSAA